jgi:hypothetical protein
MPSSLRGFYPDEVLAPHGRRDSLSSDLVVVAWRYYAITERQGANETFRERMTRTLRTVGWEDIGG